MDDNAANLLALEAVLAAPDIKLVRAGSGPDALRWLLQEEFAAILLDIHMPEMDGVETAALIRERAQSGDTPILFITAFDSTEQQVLRGYLSGAVDFLMKPIVPDILKAKVRVFVDLYRKKAELAAQALALAAANDRLKQEISERQRVETALQERNEELAKQSAEIARLSTHLQSIREDEKARLARELHDELGTALMALKLNAHWILKHLPSSASRELVQHAIALLSQIDAAVQDTRSICTGLRPTILDHLGLGAAIQWLAREFVDNSGIRCNVALPDEEIEVQAPYSIGLFRIAQEALTNVARHSKATDVQISLKRTDDHVALIIHDNGIGFDPRSPASLYSHGINGMMARAREFNGSVQVTSSASGGTQVQAMIPLP
ncbi:MAG TPA: response regulator, partial [Burkholderiales bacterium]|nr:response regulator [Burkholderiales bacterium]